MMDKFKEDRINEIKHEILVTLQGHQKNSSDIIIIPIKYLVGSFIGYDEDVYKSTNRRPLQMRWMQFSYSGWLHKQEMLLLRLGRYACNFGKLQCNGSAKISRVNAVWWWLIIYNVQFNKILTCAGGTSIASETCQAGSQNLRLRNAPILSIKDFLVW